jgi:hypothetical protein
MALTDHQRKWIRSEIGDDVLDVVLDETFDRLGSVRDVALETLRKRRTAWLTQPMNITVSGVVGLNLAENVKAVERQIAQLVKMDDDPSDNAGGGTVAAAGESDYLTISPLPRTRRR